MRCEAKEARTNELWCGDTVYGNRESLTHNNNNRASGPFRVKRGLPQARDDQFSGEPFYQTKRFCTLEYTSIYRV